jgi:hypothetical protein
MSLDKPSVKFEYTSTAIPTFAACCQDSLGGLSSASNYGQSSLRRNTKPPKRVRTMNKPADCGTKRINDFVGLSENRARDSFASTNPIFHVSPTQRLVQLVANQP